MGTVVTDVHLEFKGFDGLSLYFYLQNNSPSIWWFQIFCLCSSIDQCPFRVPVKKQHLLSEKKKVHRMLFESLTKLRKLNETVVSCTLTPAQCYLCLSVRQWSSFRLIDNLLWDCKGHGYHDN